MESSGRLKKLLSRELAQLEEDTLVYLGVRESVDRGYLPKTDLPDPPEAYILYRRLEHWNFQHLPVPGGLENQPYLVMLQLDVVRKTINQFESQQARLAALTK